MKTTHNNSRLDNFLRDELKNLNIQYQQSDWSDMESMLGPAEKPIDFNISKKTILISASVLVIIIIVIIISQTVHFTSSPTEATPPQNTSSSPNVLKPADTQSTSAAVPAPVMPAIDSIKTETSTAMQAHRIADSLKHIATFDTISSRKINATQKVSIKNIPQKAEKNKKQSKGKNTSSVDSALFQTIPPLPVLDTVSKHPQQEATLSTPTDSSKKSRKEKRQKLKFLFRQKKDSLKQQ